MRQPSRPGRDGIASRTAIALLVVLTISAGSALALPPDGDPWIQVQTTNLILFSDAPQEQTVRIGADLERFRVALSRSHPTFSFRSTRPTFIYVFRSAAAFRSYAGAKGGSRIFEAGVFLPREDANYVAMETEHDASRIIYHEYMHYFLHNNLPSIPRWFDEGVAECYSTFRVDEKGAQLGLPIEGHLRWLAEHPLIPLHDLFAVESTFTLQEEEARTGTFYAQSWALVHDLLWGNPQRRPQLSAFLDGLQRGLSLEDAFRAGFPAGYDDLQTEIARYVSQRKFPYNTMPFETQSADAKARVTPMARDEVLYRLGDLLAQLSVDRGAEAEEHFQAATKINPANAAAYAGLGLLRYRQDRFAEEAAFYDKAVALDPGNYLTNFRYARSLLHQPEAGARPETVRHARELLNKVIALRPTFAEAYVELGMSYVTNLGEPAAGIAALEKARGLLPTRMDLPLNLVHLYLRAGDRARAQDLVDSVLSRGNDPVSLEAARLALALSDPARTALLETDEAARRRAEQEFLDLTRDPESRRILEQQLAQGQDFVTYNKQVEIYNKAIDLANRRDYKGAIKLLETMLPEIKDKDLAEQTRSLLARLRQDASRKPKAPS
ncbi:MAG TPA: tetratricopeptide repeat protein [Candidatus Polarisedimenticolia bacterium]|nr:tetratricopeptide repeat protein [Candidatus Polarisedimenticolia bacterium]